MTTALLAIALLTAAAGRRDCRDSLPIDPAVITAELELKAFAGATQAGPVCHVSWDGPGSPSLVIYGPTALAGMGRRFGSPRQAADQYAGESPRGVEAVPGLAGAFMVFDPATPNRRVFVTHRGKVYMIVSQEQIPLAVLVKAVRGP
jgi:hypothetical protein